MKFAYLSYKKKVQKMMNEEFKASALNTKKNNNNKEGA